MTPTLGELYAVLEQRQQAAGRITGLEHAHERDWLSDAEQEELGRWRELLPVLEAEAHRLWGRMSAEDCAELDRRIAAAFLRLRTERVAGFEAADLEPRVAQLGAPQRTLDSWAVWALLSLSGGSSAPGHR